MERTDEQKRGFEEHYKPPPHMWSLRRVKAGSEGLHGRANIVGTGKGTHNSEVPGEHGMVSDDIFIIHACKSSSL